MRAHMPCSFNMHFRGARQIKWQKYAVLPGCTALSKKSLKF